MPEPIQTTAPTPHLPTEDGHPAEPARPPTPTLSVVTATPPLSSLALECIDKIDGVLIPLVAVSANPLVALLVGFKAGHELAECVDDARFEAQQRAAIQECVAVGGNPIGIVDNVVHCEVVKP